MKIAQIAPLWESVPPQRYGGTARVVSYLTEELVRLGHEVTLFASGDSTTTAQLEPLCPEAVRCDSLSQALCREAPFFLLLERAFGASAGRFDVIHSHIDFMGFPLARRCRTPVITTLHGRLDWPELTPIFREFGEMPVVSISQAQREPVGWANWKSTVPHGVPQNLYSFHPEPGKYLAFLGRLSPEKGVEQAIEVAKQVGMTIRIAAKVDPADREYFNTQIERRLEHSLVEYVGEITDEEKNDFLGEAYALLCPHDGPEPFGLGFIEALACGTPVLAYRQGSTAEIVDHEQTGLLCETLEEMVAAVPRVGNIDRHQCRRSFEDRFTAERMTTAYLEIYERLVNADQRDLPSGFAPTPSRKEFAGLRAAV